MRLPNSILNLLCANGLALRIAASAAILKLALVAALPFKTVRPPTTAKVYALHRP